MSILAATLANGGENPLTGKKIFDAFYVRYEFCYASEVTKSGGKLF